ncbi:unnamed protein product [Arabis nemorensis]|uniref:TIR domain-containing protein n=1 Tax=Arabis nemorensis TaxID=586526 RepID=A0A565CF69_9BRAS|nr:unnamed protein product [Arabis nemorensis]
MATPAPTPPLPPLPVLRPRSLPPPSRISRPPHLPPLPLPGPRRPQLFVSFRGNELLNGFVSHVVKALRVAGVNIFIDSYDFAESGV